MQKIKNKKGITLVEAIISIAIMSTVLFISYKIINKVNISTVNQNIISTEQQSINLIRKYLNKDLERCKSVELKTYEDYYTYDMLIPDEGIIKYEIIINNNKYSVARVESDERLEIISNQRLNSDNRKPLIIEKNNGTYRIYLDSYNGDDDLYYFDISSKTNKIKVIHQSVNNNMILESTNKQTIKPKIGEKIYNETIRMKDYMNKILIDVNLRENKISIKEIDFIGKDTIEIGKYDNVFEGKFNEIKKFTIDATSNSKFYPSEIKVYDKVGHVYIPYLKGEKITIDLNTLNKVIEKIEIEINILGRIAIEFDN